MKKLFKNEKIINIIIFTIFILISLIVATKHEPWADEAQSWMIARDNSFVEIMKITRYEGTPCLWTMILRIFIKIGLSYEYFFIVPIIFSSIGIFLILFKLKMPQILKIVLPFSYFIMYQYTIVIRSYCLILPILACIALLYEKKDEDIIKYSMLLAMLMGVSAHTYLMSGCLFLDLVVCLYKKYKLKINKKMVISIIVLSLLYIITLIMVFPNENNNFTPSSKRSLCVAISNALFSSKFHENLIDEILCFIIFAIFIKQVKLKNKMFLLLFLISPLMVNTLIHSEIWHIGIFFLTFVFCCIFTEVIYNKPIKYMLLIMCIISINWTIMNCQAEILHVMSPNEEVVAYLKEIDAENKKVYGIGYNPVEFNPYFKANLYDNYKSEKGYFKWNKDNGYMSRDEILNDLPDVFICHGTLSDIVPQDAGYTKKVFEAQVFSRGEKYISNTMHVYVRNK